MAFSQAIFSQTQWQMNQEAIDRYKKVDTEQNVLYKQILGLYAADSSFITRLKASEEAWIKYRDAQLEMKYPSENDYGSARPMCVSIYLEELTNERIKALRVWVDGIEEGDICGGSVRIEN